MRSLPDATDLSLRLRRRFRAAAVGMLALTLSSCGTLARDFSVGEAGLVRSDDPRLDLKDAAVLQSLGGALMSAADTEKRPLTILAISGGGANGAYGAGVLAGWSAHGDRPRFDLVTGVSTGALSAPFAFLGSEWDDKLREAYTSGAIESLISWRSLAVFLTPSLFSSDVLVDLVDHHVTPEMLRQIAAEHAKGRRLLVVTTDLDAEAAVIWDMGLIASRGDENALHLFRKVLVASASIPGVFTPVLIAHMRPDGTIVRDMHVDGGVTIPFLASPVRPVGLNPGNGRAKGWSGDLYVILNGQLGFHHAVTPGSLSGILKRTYITSTKAATSRELSAAITSAAASNLRLSVTEIPAEAEPSSLDFSRDAMTDMFALGRREGLSGNAWRREILPSLEP